MKAHWQNQYHHRENSSQLHEALRAILITDPRFKNLHCFQEVQVQELCPDYPHRGHAFDWYIAELNCVIELHGAQHYHPVNFGGISFDAVLSQFRAGQWRDGIKYHAAQSAGMVYTEIPYTLQRKLTGDLLLCLIEAATDTQ